MKHDIDSLSAELTQELILTPLEKKLPPKLLYRYRRWMQQFGGKQAAQVAQVVQKAMDHMEAVRSLQKNEMLASIYDNGHIRLDFGSKVDSKVKDAAMKWAKSRGLKASEASLNKNADDASWIVYSKDNSQPGTAARFIKYTV